MLVSDLVMNDKQTIIEALDRRQLLLPARIREGMQANARVKYYLSLLQMASTHADDPDAPANDLAPERERCGLDDADLDAVVPGARRVDDDTYRIPRLHEISARIGADLERMMAPVELWAGRDAVDPWRHRLEVLREEQRELVGDDTVEAGTLSWMTSVAPEHDSPHHLCIDLHKALDEVAQNAVTENVDGAGVFGILESDRPLVAAFMRGVNATAKLKFDHPGLGTTGTRDGARLVLENDIGTTDAHVIVVEVEGPKVVVTSADVHVQRLAFFQRLLAAYPVEWDDTRSRRAAGLEEGSFFLCVGTFVAKDDSDLRAFLERLGSRLVFLIDWNRARKTLQAFVPKGSAVALLDGAAGDDLGHRAFLELGGEKLVYDAMAAVMRTPMRFGERLEDAIGADAATTFLRFVLRESAEGLLEGRSHSLIRERVFAELASSHMHAGNRLLDPVLRHARLVQGLAADVASAAAAAWHPDGVGARKAAAARAKDRERDADEVVVEVRSLVERMPDGGGFDRVLQASDDAADELEEAAFTATLMPPGAMAPDAVRLALERLTHLVEEDCAAWIACVESARHAHRGSVGPEMRAFLGAIDRVFTIERETDDAERHATTELMLVEGVDPRVLFVVARIAHELEAATDSLMHAAAELRDRVQGGVMIDRP